uniref:Uncharacterized protein n=1 Tax=Rhizophora mucronata TaxID=61149 RepID=A0A2P2QJ34_RHIMU
MHKTHACEQVSVDVLPLAISDPSQDPSTDLTV